MINKGGDIMKPSSSSDEYSSLMKIIREVYHDRRNRGINKEEKI